MWQYKLKLMSKILNIFLYKLCFTLIPPYLIIFQRFNTNKQTTFIRRSHPNVGHPKLTNFGFVYPGFSLPTKLLPDVFINMDCLSVYLCITNSVNLTLYDLIIVTNCKQYTLWKFDFHKVTQKSTILCPYLAAIATIWVKM